MPPDACGKSDEYRGTLIDMALDDTAHCDALKLAEVIRHVDACPHCKAELIGYQRLIASLRPRVPEVPPHRIAMLESAVRAEVARIQRRTRIARWVGSIAAAAAIVAACVLLWPTGDTQPTEGPEEVATSMPKPSETRMVARPEARGLEPERRPKLGRPPAEIMKEIVALRSRAERSIEARQFGEAVQNDLTNAKRLARTLITAEPDCPTALKARFELYRCYELLGEDYQRERAFKDYIEQILGKGGEEAAARALVDDGRRLMQKGNSTIAGRRLNSALKSCSTGPVAIAARLLLAKAYEGSELHDSAYREYKEAIVLNPPAKVAAGIYERMVVINTRRRKFAAAIGDAEALCRLPDDDFPQLDRVIHHCRLARLYERNGDVVASVRVLRNVIAECESPANDVAKVALMRIQRRTIGKEIGE